MVNVNRWLREIDQTVFNLGKRARLITESPFEWIKKGALSIRRGVSEVRADIMPDILDACPSQKLAGVVCSLAIRWTPKDGNRYTSNGMTFSGVLQDSRPFTENSPLRRTRRAVCPLFPRKSGPSLRICFELAKPGAVYVLDEDIRGRSETRDL